ncbi:hypothetical protein Hypma_014204 [Hypsizygus marmoreus]|uniref:Uncharacterized protein n=1 Tax=Hypsizygus marmoreus TaxID=39966 RepID=A0A369JD70_HYPMA|nr:hypothetical protein Hypma_014204 [Hypsizygus marmoreus]
MTNTPMNLREFLVHFRSKIPLSIEAPSKYRVDANSWVHRFYMFNRMRYNVIINFHLKHNYIMGDVTAEEVGKAAIARHYDGETDADDHFAEAVIKVYNTL